MLIEIKESDLSYGNQDLGQGASGKVYRGTWQNMPVAVKRFHSQQGSYFTHEKDMLSMLEHPQIIKLIGHLTTKTIFRTTIPLLVLELMDQSFDHYLQQHEHSNRKQAECDKILLDICKGLHYLHEVGIIHGDIKPQNILLDKNQGAKIADFDSSMQLEKNKEKYSSNDLVGTDRFSAPEMYSQFYTKAYDIFPLALMLWICAMPDVYIPYAQEPGISAFFKHESGLRHLIPDDVSQERKSLITYGWDANPEKRPAAKQFVEFFEREIKNKI